MKKVPLFQNRIVFITGGTGSWGQEFTRQILAQDPKEVRIYSRGEYEQVQMRRRFHNHPALFFVIGDIRDRERVLAKMRGADFVIHLAALKHVPVVEDHPEEALAINTTGTQHVIDAAITNQVKKVLFVSSDKAVDPLNFYGITKLAGERLMAAAHGNGFTKFITYRGGNVMGSRGSIIPIFQEQILRDGQITITDPAMTRFFMSVRESVSLALAAFETGVGSEIFIPTMKSISLEGLAQAMIEGLGKKKVKIRLMGPRPGEKQAELLISRSEVSRIKYHDPFWILLPFFPAPDVQAKYSGLPQPTFTEFDSASAPHFSLREFKELLKAEGFLDKNIPVAKDPLFFKKGKWYFS
jgi:FlaA1/EpsC-like NDP-sugar epimerase